METVERVVRPMSGRASADSAANASSSESNVSRSTFAPDWKRSL
jgi:hypothetical protein